MTQRTITGAWTGRTITVEDGTPTWSIGRIMDNVHVGTSHDEVREMWIERLARVDDSAFGDHDSDRIRADVLRYAAWVHDENRACYSIVMGGSL